MSRRDVFAAAAGALAATALAGGVAWAGIPGDGGVYTACMLKGVGTVRLIDKSLPATNLMSHCKPALEIEVTWNRQGSQGAQGPPGSQGEQGEKGDKGDPGDAGTNGAGAPTACLAVGDSTPSVAGCTLLQVDGSGSNLEITSLENGVSGQVLTIRGFVIPNGNGQVTVQDDSPFQLAGDMDFGFLATLQLVNVDGQWLEVSRSEN